VLHQTAVPRLEGAVRARRQRSGQGEPKQSPDKQRSGNDDAVIKDAQVNAEPERFEKAARRQAAFHVAALRMCELHLADPLLDSGAFKFSVQPAGARILL
jgi:hypothetical protein